MHELLVLLPQKSARYEGGLAFFKWGLTLAGIGIIVIGAGLLLSKPKDPEKTTSPVVKWLGLAIVASIGCGLIAYAWLAF